jgi:subtilisin family serine protease
MYALVPDPKRKEDPTMSRRKLSPGLLVVLDDFDHPDSFGLDAVAHSASVVRRNDPSAPHAAPVFLECAAEADLSELAALGVQVNQPVGAVRTALVPLVALEEVAAHPAIERIGASHRARPLLDLAGPAVGLPIFRSSTGLDGQGVIVGIVDSGIDANHSAFTGRILRIWDQTLPSGG